MYKITYMRFHRPIEDLVRGRASVRVIKALLGSPTKGFTGRELAGVAQVHPSDALDVLNRLRSYGLVDRRTIGRAHLWEVNRNHWLVKPLGGLIKADDGAVASLHSLIRSHLEALPEVRRVVLFGSVARGDERPNSDIDILIVTATAKQKNALGPPIRELREGIDSTFTNPLREIIYSAPEYERKRRSGLVRNIERDGITLLDRTLDENREASARQG